MIKKLTKTELKTWTNKLEAGIQDEPTLQLAQRLRQEKPAAQPPSLQFTQTLRRKMLAQYPEPKTQTAGWQLFRQRVGSAALLGLLTIAVVAAWFNMSRTTSPVAGGGKVSATRAASPAGVTSNIIYDQLEITLSENLISGMESNKIIAESWQTPDGKIFHAKATTPNDNIIVFTQQDEEFFREGMFSLDLNHMEMISQMPINQLPALFIHSEHDSHRNRAPFYASLGWEGLAQAVVAPEWGCTDYACVIKALIYPPVGIDVVDGQYENFGYGGSLIGEEVEGNGRSVATLHITHQPSNEQPVEVNGRFITPLPQPSDKQPAESDNYRLVKVDATTFQVLEVTDYIDNTLLRSLKRLEHKTISATELPNDLFTTIPAEMEILTLGKYPTFGKWLQLDNITTSNPPVPATGHLKIIPGKEFKIMISWIDRNSIEQSNSSNYTITLHLLDEAGKLVAQQDQQIVVKRLAFLQENSTVNSSDYTYPFLLPIPSDLAPGEYKLFVSVIDPNTNQQLKIKTGETTYFLKPLTVVKK